MLTTGKLNELSNRDLLETLELNIRRVNGLQEQKKEIESYNNNIRTELATRLTDKRELR